MNPRPSSLLASLRLLAAWVLTLFALLAVAALTGCGPSGPVALAYVANAGGNHVQVIDLASGETLRRIYAGATPWRLVVEPGDGRLWAQHWFSGTTAVIDLADHRVADLLPYRGPGTFSADGSEFLTFDWPSSMLTTVGRESLEVTDERRTEIKQVYDLSADPERELIHAIQYDPMARGPAPRYGYIATYPYRAEEISVARPLSRPTGHSPVRVLRVPGAPFLITADSGTNGLSVLNDLGDGRSLAACRAPRDLTVSEDLGQMVVLCREGHGRRGSELVTFDTDFSARPWPEFEERARRAVVGELTALTVHGAHLYALDATRRELLELEPSSLETLRRVPVGDAPRDVVVVEVPVAARERLEAGPSPARHRLEELLATLIEAGEPFTTLSWVETATWYEPPPPPPEGGEEGGEEEGEPVERTRRLEQALRSPSALRTVSGEGVRLARGGSSLALDRHGRYWVTPRQELVSVLYALPNLTPGDAVRRLAGDVPGSPFLSSGLAVDLATEVEEQGHRYLVVGTDDPEVRISQLWFDLETGRPVDLVEQFPSFGTSPHDDTAPELVETRLDGWTDGPLPKRLERVVEGRFTQEVAISDVRLDEALPEAYFSLDRLAGVEPSGQLFRSPEGPVAVADDGGPGQPVPVQTELEAGEIPTPLSPHAPYNSNPPTSGAHLPYTAEWGVHRVPVPLALQVHNLLDGGVALQYDCPGGCPELVAKLEELAASRDHALVAPYPYQESRLVVTAWGRMLRLDGYEAEPIEAFLDAYAGVSHHEEGDGR